MLEVGVELIVDQCRKAGVGLTSIKRAPKVRSERVRRIWKRKGVCLWSGLIAPFIAGRGGGTARLGRQPNFNQFSIRAIFMPSRWPSQLKTHKNSSFRSSADLDMICER